MAPQTAPARQNLPLDSDSFVGRERDLSDLLRLLDADRVVTLCGVNGIGKTRLALRVAAHATGSFPDGVWLVELAQARGRDEAVARIAAAVGVAEEAGRDLEYTLRDALARRRLLLVLDGCGPVLDLLPDICHRLLADCPSVSLLITAEEPVRLEGEAIWRVPPLSPPPREKERDPTSSEAVRLFVDRARAASPGFCADSDDLRVVADICGAVDSIPYCVELVASWVRRIPLPEIAAEIRARVGELYSRHTGAADRARLMTEVIRWSYERIGLRERILLRRLAVFADWDLELAERVCPDGPLPEAEILDLLSALAGRSLITLNGEAQGRVRYRFPAVVRRFMAHRLAEAGEEEAFRLRHREQMVLIAEDLGRSAVLGRAVPWAQRFASWTRVVTEYDNIREALHWSAERGDAEAGLRLCIGLSPFWVTGSRFIEGGVWSDRFLELPGAAEGLRGRAMVRRAELARAEGDRRYASEIGEAGLQRCRAAGDTESLIMGQNLLAMVDVREHADDRAHERLTEVLELSRKTGDLWNEAVALGTQGMLATRCGDFDRADVHYSTSMMILRGMDHRWGVGAMLIGQGIAAEARGDLAGADRCYRESLDIQRDFGSAAELARCLAGVGRIAHALGATTQAFDYLSESLSLSHSAGLRRAVASALASIAKVAAGEGMVEGACRLGGAAAAIREETGPATATRSWPLKGTGCDGEPAALSQWWDEGFAMGVDDAAALALHITETGRVPRPRPSRTTRTASPEQTLTRREHEIARLVGEGRSNRAIAEQLFITPATVARHVANINRKTGFSSRKQIAAWLNDHKASR
ncbi:putative ATPase/DNA-binding CsgD family transcriptional regulator [Nocardiopsis mwathae]|uniref:Putative ATPase/DNA-binding CsgD family transcriptional regulator n=1 Tax=Nocardiopsis mwathae TaxID=1472723 RepID=A0A7W9YIS4_9ACTN|nr:LuxR C-terminal-related transcriptional regulator [Nocardiopsis mwathae]MBB6172943.1 putative ATPase/DNA-binding CsgD family transcriptional regulator [Nocardiopsis mwathae]